MVASALTTLVMPVLPAVVTEGMTFWSTVDLMMTCGIGGRWRTGKVALSRCCSGARVIGDYISQVRNRIIDVDDVRSTSHLSSSLLAKQIGAVSLNGIEKEVGRVKKSKSPPSLEVRQLIELINDKECNVQWTVSNNGYSWRPDLYAGKLTENDYRLWVISFAGRDITKVIGKKHSKEGLIVSKLAEDHPYWRCAKLIIEQHMHNPRFYEVVTDPRSMFRDLTAILDRRVCLSISVDLRVLHTIQSGHIDCRSISSNYGAALASKTERIPASILRLERLGIITRKVERKSKTVVKPASIRKPRKPPKSKKTTFTPTAVPISMDQYRQTIHSLEISTRGDLKVRKIFESLCLHIQRTKPLEGETVKLIGSMSEKNRTCLSQLIQIDPLLSYRAADNLTEIIFTSDGKLMYDWVRDSKISNGYNKTFPSVVAYLNANARRNTAIARVELSTMKAILKERITANTLTRFISERYVNAGFEGKELARLVRNSPTKKMLMSSKAKKAKVA